MQEFDSLGLNTQNHPPEPKGRSNTEEAAWLRNVLEKAEADFNRWPQWMDRFSQDLKWEGVELSGRHRVKKNVSAPQPIL